MQHHGLIWIIGKKNQWENYPVFLMHGNNHYDNG